MNFVATDLGASGTRYVTDHGKIQVLPNNMNILPYGTKTSLELNSDAIEQALELTIERLTPIETDEQHPDYSEFPVTLLAGNMVERYSTDYVTPNINMLKYKQRVNYISAIMTAAVAKLKFGLSDELVLVLDMPPGELTKAKEAFKRILIGKYRVTFDKFMGGTVVEFEVKNVAVFAESVMAMSSFFFNMNGVVRPENKGYMTGRVLSLDIGASTSDLAIIEDGGFLDKTGRTIKVGGNTARSYFIDAISSEYGIQLTESDAERIIAEGRMPLGDEYEDVGVYVEAAKKSLANQLIHPLDNYFSQVGTPISSVRAIIVSGGGSMAGHYINEAGEVVNTSAPLSSYVTEAIQTVCKGIKAIPYGEDARFANTKGLFIRAKFLMARLNAQAVAEAQATQTVAPVQPVQQATPVQQAAVPVQPVATPVQAQATVQGTYVPSGNVPVI